MINSGANGLLAPPEDPAGLAAAIVRLLEDLAWGPRSATLVAGGQRHGYAESRSSTNWKRCIVT